MDLLLISNSLENTYDLVNNIDNPQNRFIIETIRSFTNFHPNRYDFDLKGGSVLGAQLSGGGNKAKAIVKKQMELRKKILKEKKKAAKEAAKAAKATKAEADKAGADADKKLDAAADKTPAEDPNKGMEQTGDDQPKDDSGFVTGDFTLRDIFRTILKILVILIVLCFFGAMGPWVIFAFYSWKKVKKNFKIYINNM
jgi:hypothetical protein